MTDIIEGCLKVRLAKELPLYVFTHRYDGARKAIAQTPLTLRRRHQILLGPEEPCSVGICNSIHLARKVILREDRGNPLQETYALVKDLRYMSF